MSGRPPSVDALARTMRDLPRADRLPHAVLVDLARGAIASGDWSSTTLESAVARFADSLVTEVINATGVLLHTNLGRAPLPTATRSRTIEFDLGSGRRGSRQTGIGRLLGLLCGAESALVVNNNAAAVMLVAAALADGREVAVSRGEAVEIGGSFRVPEVIERSGARLVDVGTTNRTRADDYRRAITRPGADVALILSVHPSNYRIEGFTERPEVRELAALGVPVAVDIGSGLADADTPWLAGAPPAWLTDEPAARQTLEAGADLVTFSTDKLLGGPQAGVIAGRAELVARCAQHPLMRALRPGSLVIESLQSTVMALLDRRPEEVAFWSMASAPVAEVRARAERIAEACPESVSVVDLESLPGAGSAPGRGIPSAGLALDVDLVTALRRCAVPVIARLDEGRTVIDLRSVSPVDDEMITAAITSVLR
ncbi:MAG: L-seryl-tRNA(Sec) selenium transferase [Ilumatobacteraceae bacterium]|nr:L-seryl-tRNA(Sec) selenium transferase [Actinomycetota bacterium]MDA2974586.1 L-seryl-tRNA(Sec) selenium transferase [Actinomycetota bacterium]